jgi:hypothetical protein
MNVTQEETQDNFRYPVCNVTNTLELSAWCFMNREITVIIHQNGCLIFEDFLNEY